MQQVDRFLDRVRGRREKKSTIENRVRALECFADWCGSYGIDNPSEVGVGEIKDYLGYLGRENYSGASVRGRWWSLNVFFKELIEDGKLEENPLQKIDKKKYRDLFNKSNKEDYLDARGGIFALEEEGIHKIADNVPANGNKTRNRLIVLLSYHTGVRRQELADMKLENIDRQERRIDVYSSKSDSEYVDKSPWRPVWYGPSLDPLMDKWIEVEREGYITSDSPHLFISLRAERMSGKQINEIVKETADNAGIQEYMPEDAGGYERAIITHHSLRHSFARACMTPDETGARIDVKRLANLMGNDPETVSKKYLHFAEDDDRQSRELYGPR